MSEDKGKITVYYDGACPSCVRDRRHYEKLAGKSSEQVCWFDITGREDQLRQIGIDPHKALTELHVSDADWCGHYAMRVRSCHLSPCLGSSVCPCSWHGCLACRLSASCWRVSIIGWLSVVFGRVGGFERC